MQKGKLVVGQKISRRQGLKLISSALSIPPLAGLMACSTPTTKDADVIIIGAGLAGLQAALLLEEQGLNVLVLEGSQRVGGRVFTLDHIEGKPEAGASEIGAHYARVHNMLDQIGSLPMINFKDVMDLNLAININGKTMNLETWSSSSLNALNGRERNTHPFKLSSLYMPASSPLGGLESWLEQEHLSWDIPFGRFLRQQGASDEAIRLIQSQMPSDHINSISTLWRLRHTRFQQAMSAPGALHRIKTGMSRLPEGMAQMLRRDIRFASHVIGMRSHDKSVEVHTKNGKIYRASFCICTTPVTSLRHIKIEPSLPPLQKEAVSKIPQGNATSVFYQVKKPYWMEDGLPASFKSDTETGRVFRLRTDNGDMLWQFIDGARNATFRHLDDQTIMHQSLADLHKKRPSMKGRVTPLAVMNWSRYPWLKGYNAYRSPGQITQYGNVIAQSHHRIHFAGEQTSVTMMGMEGAMESGERAAIEVLERL